MRRAGHDAPRLACEPDYRAARSTHAAAPAADRRADHGLVLPVPDHDGDPQRGVEVAAGRDQKNLSGCQRYGLLEDRVVPPVDLSPNHDEVFLGVDFGTDRRRE
jgi:hypothetical protein